MKMYFRNNKGFTLIELLVVVAIIGLLSSVVLASLNSARGKAKDAAIKEEVSQLVNLMALNYNDYGSYLNLRFQVIGSSGTCGTLLTGIYATQAEAICTNIYNNAGDIGEPPGSWRIWSNTSSSSGFFFIVALNNGKWFCSNGNGEKGEYSDFDFDVQPGCN
jgi:type IV pilus assembly protein PilA